MKNPTVFSYDKQPQCDYCAFEEGGACRLNSEQRPCAQFRYDVFKRKPRQSPGLPKFDEEDFQI